MRSLFTILLLAITISLFSQESGHIVLNPLTGKLEYVSNPYAIGDSLVNLGYDNNIARSTLSTMIGYGNFLGQPDCIAIGWNNSTNCEQNFALGKYIECNGEKVIMIGMSNRKVEARMPGSVAFCPPGEYAVMHIHSGYGMGANTYVGNKGGVRIGQGSAYNTDSTALEIFAHIRENTPDNAQLIATENGEWVVDPDEMTLAGSFATGYIECPTTPKVHSAAADTSLLPIPLKIGDYYIDTSARDVYISIGTVRGSWKKAN